MNVTKLINITLKDVSVQLVMPTKEDTFTFFLLLSTHMPNFSLPKSMFICLSGKWATKGLPPEVL